MSTTRRTFNGLAAAAGLAALGETKAFAAPPVMEGGLQEAVLSVFDLDQIATPWVDVGGYKRVALPDADRSQYAAWHVPPECTRIEQALLVPGHADSLTGSLRLVKFHGVAQRVMRSSQRSWDTGGIFDVDVFTGDVEHAYRGLQARGWTALGEPVDYSEASFHVRQAVAVGPSGMMLAMIQRYSPAVPNLPPDSQFTPIFNSTQMIADYDRAIHFYTQVLDWDAALQFGMDDAVEPGADVLGLPMPYAKTAKRRLAMARPRWLTGGQIELIENKSMTGRDFSQYCVAPNVGLLCLRFPAPDAAAYAAQIVARGGELYARLAPVTIAPYGRTIAFSVRSPEGAILEFFEKRAG